MQQQAAQVSAPGHSEHFPQSATQSRLLERELEAGPPQLEGIARTQQEVQHSHSLPLTHCA